MEFLDVEMQKYDILIFTETWLTPQTPDDDLFISNFESMYRKDRRDQIGGGVAIYIRTSIQTVRRHDIIQGDIEEPCVKVSMKDGLPHIVHGFRNRHFINISLDTMLYFHN